MGIVKVLVVGGGGAGMGNKSSNWNSGDGGSAGQLKYNDNFTVNDGFYSVIVGAGSSGVNGPTIPSNGGDSSFSTITATGGTSGQYGSSSVARTGGRGAGGAGGGPYAYENGGYAGAGGIGLSYDIDGTSKYYAGGGGGGFTYGGAGGSGVGGRGESYNQSNGSAGATNTGSGGGGRSNPSAASPGYNGGSGIVIIRYQTSLLTCYGGTITIDGDYTIHTFTSSGTFLVGNSVPLTFGEYLPTNNTSFLLHLNGNSLDSSYNVNGTDNDMTYTNGRFGKCASFNGSTSYIDLGTGLSVNTPLTCVAWIKISNYSTNNLYLAKRDSTSGENCQYEFYTQLTSGKLSYFNGIAEYPGNSQVPVNEWVCVITTLSSSTNGILKHYINGKLDSTTNNVSIGSGTSTLPVHIGDAGGQSASSEHFNGMIDEIIFENIEWSSEKIKKYYTYTKGRFGNL